MSSLGLSGFGTRKFFEPLTKRLVQLMLPLLPPAPPSPATKMLTRLVPVASSMNISAWLGNDELTVERLRTPNRVFPAGPYSEIAPAERMRVPPGKGGRPAGGSVNNAPAAPEPLSL